MTTTIQKISACVMRILAGAAHSMAWLALLALVSLSVASRADEVTYFHNDASGTPLVATDANGAVLWKENYRPYGDRLNNQSASTNNHLWFTGKLYDATSGLSYIGARYYDPMVGRFVGVDPAPFSESNLHSFNRYAYANNNPYKFVDEDGHSPLDIGFLVYDIGKLTVAIYTGTGVGAALVDVALDAVGVISPIPGTGQAFKAIGAVDKVVDVARVADHAIDAAKAASDFGGLTRAAEFGIKSYTDLRKLTKGTGLDAHHLIEKRFASILGVSEGSLMSVAVTKAEHQRFTNAWRKAIGYGDGTANATNDQILAAAREIYKDYPELLKIIEDAAKQLK